LESDATFESLSTDYPLLDAIVNETLRLHPVVMQVHREASEDSFIPLTPLQDSSPRRGLSPEHLSHLFVPKGTILVLPVNIMQITEDIWGPDAGIWNAQRWTEITSKEAHEKRSDWRREIMAFSLG